jgi:hypothetical protein
MKKIIRITESQLLNIVDKKKNLIEQEISSTYREHWEHKFMKSIEVLLKLGHKPDELIEKIKIISNNKQI